MNFYRRPSFFMALALIVVMISPEAYSAPDLYGNAKDLGHLSWEQASKAVEENFEHVMHVGEKAKDAISEFATSTGKNIRERSGAFASQSWGKAQEWANMNQQIHMPLYGTAKDTVGDLANSASETLGWSGGSGTKSQDKAKEWADMNTETRMRKYDGLYGNKE